MVAPLQNSKLGRSSTASIAKKRIVSVIKELVLEEKAVVLVLTLRCVCLAARLLHSQFRRISANNDREITPYCSRIERDTELIVAHVNLSHAEQVLA